MNNKDKKQKIKALMTRRGVVMIALIALVVILISAITASYSWFTPQQQKGDSMSYAFDGKARSENCSFSTFRGTKLDGSDANHTPASGEYYNQIRYNATASTGSVSITAGSTYYFKTEVINADPNNASDISLFIKSMPAGTLSVTYPGNSVRTFASVQTDCYIVRDAYVKKNVATDVNGPGKLVIEWFIIPKTSTSINLNNLYLVYN